MLIMVGCTAQKEYEKYEDDKEFVEIPATELLYKVDDEEIVEKITEIIEDIPIDFSQWVISSFSYDDGLIHLWLSAGRGEVLLDSKGNVIIPPTIPGIRSAENFANYMAVMESLGRTVIPIIFPLPHMDTYSYVVNMRALGYGLIAARIRHENTLESQQDALYGIFDMQGNEIISPTFHHIYPFNEGRAVTLSHIPIPDDPHGGIYVLYGAIDTYGNEIFSLTNGDRLVTFHEGLAGVQIGDWDWTRGVVASNHNILWGFVDMEGNEVIPPRFRFATHFNHGVAVVDYKSVCNWACRCSGPEGIALINTRGEYIIPPYMYYHIRVCDQGIVFTVTGTSVQVIHEECGFVRQWVSSPRIGLRDIEGNVLAPPIYSSIRTYTAPSEGHLLWPTQYSYPTQTFRESRAAVQCYYTGMWGYIDVTGYEVIPTQFTYAGTFINGVALVNVGGEIVDYVSGLMGAGGSQLILGSQPHYWYTRPIIHGTWHVIDLYGNILESFEYIYVRNINGYLFIFSNELVDRERGGTRRWMVPELVNHGIIVLERD